MCDGELRKTHLSLRWKLFSVAREGERERERDCSLSALSFSQILFPKRENMPTNHGPPCHLFFKSQNEKKYFLVEKLIY